MSEATMRSKGQITIPVAIRKALGLHPGEKIVFTQLDDGTTVLRAKTRSILDLGGILANAPTRQHKVEIVDMNLGRD